jgi:hypothetical protein
MMIRPSHILHAHQISERVRIEQILKDEIAQFEEKRLAERARQSALLYQSDAYAVIDEKARKGQQLSNEDWESAVSLVKKVLPNCYQFLFTQQCYRPDSNEFRTCVLLSIGFGVKDVSSLQGVTKAYISKISRNVLAELFNAEGSGKILARKLREQG